MSVHRFMTRIFLVSVCRSNSCELIYTQAREVWPEISLFIRNSENAFHFKDSHVINCLFIERRQTTMWRAINLSCLLFSRVVIYSAFFIKQYCLDKMVDDIFLSYIIEHVYAHTRRQTFKFRKSCEDLGIEN